MKILIATEFDNGGQMYALYKALSLYTDHIVKLVTFKQTYLNYKTDIYDPTLNKVDELVRWADFFIIGEVLREQMHTEPITNKITPTNCIIRAGGSIARKYPHLYMTGKYKGIMKTGAFHDKTIASRIFPMAPTVNIFHFDDFPKKIINKSHKIKMVFSGTGLKQNEEHSGEFMKALSLLLEKHPDKLELINIKHTSWEDTLKIKSGCDICFDQLKIGTYANSAIEGMFYRMPTFCYLSNWSQTVHPEAPLINVKTADEIVSWIEHYISNPDEMYHDGLKGQVYVKRVHSAENAIKRWESLIRFVSEEYSKK